MNLLYLGYWSVNDSLTASTIFPHLQILNELSNINKIVYVSIERGNDVKAESFLASLSKVKHVPLYSRDLGVNFLTKIGDIIRFPIALEKTVKKEEIDRVLCRTASAGAFGYMLYKRTGLPFYVESFEPHADYMLESGVWSSKSPQYLMQRYWEGKMIEHADGLMPVAENYAEYLQQLGVDENRIHTIPCNVPVEKFYFSEQDRQQKRKEYRMSAGETVGIYAGKFGGIYYNEEAFWLFKKAFDKLESLRLVILTPENILDVKRKLSQYNIDRDKVIIDFVAHAEIPKFLSMADFAFSPIKPAASRKFCSPIKDGEYWANGLPILLTKGVGDDDKIIPQTNSGAIFDLSEPETVDRAFDTIEHIINEKNYRERILKVAKDYRSFALSAWVYQRMFGNCERASF